MCGIAGWIDYSQKLTDKKYIIENMKKTLENRGPDAGGTYVSENALIGHRRLSVIDPEGGAQPMVKEKGDNRYVITYNGELYNTAALKELLSAKGYRFDTNCDTEVLLVSYIEWGPACVEHLNGIYAFGVWNEKDRSLFLARDRFGVKPLFYKKTNHSIIFGSELKTLLVHPEIKPEIDSEGLCEIFALGPARTPGHGVFKNICEIKPSHCLLLDEKGFNCRRYWTLSSYEHTGNIDETAQKLKELVVDAIERQLVSDVPLCTFLSGGLDSSAISGIAANYFRKKTSDPLETYSIDYKDNDVYFKSSLFQPDQDAPWVKKMSQRFKTNHHYIKFDTPQLISALYQATDARDLPGMADVDSSLWLFCQEIKSRNTVALSGECADEIFGGYPWFHKEELLFCNTFPWARSLDDRLKILSPDVIDFIKPKEYVHKRYTETIEDTPLLPGENSLEKVRRQMFYLNLNWFMSTLLDRKDRMSMASGLEVRVPYCDHRLVQFVWNIPWEMKMLNGREKGILRQSLKGILPQSILYRKKSPYPKTHNPSYEKAAAKLVSDIINDTGSPLLPLLNKKSIEEHLNSSQDYGRPWFGQLMAGPQLMAYLIQADYWMRKYHVTIK